MPSPRSVPTPRPDAFDLAVAAAHESLTQSPMLPAGVVIIDDVIPRRPPRWRPVARRRFDRSPALRKLAGRAVPPC